MTLILAQTIWYIRWHRSAQADSAAESRISVLERFRLAGQRQGSHARTSQTATAATTDKRGMCRAATGMHHGRTLRGLRQACKSGRSRAGRFRSGRQAGNGLGDMLLSLQRQAPARSCCSTGSCGRGCRHLPAFEPATIHPRRHLTISPRPASRLSGWDHGDRGAAVAQPRKRTQYRYGMAMQHLTLHQTGGSLQGHC